MTLCLSDDVAWWAFSAGGLVVDPEGVPFAVMTALGTYPTTRESWVGMTDAIRPLPGVISRAFGDLRVPPSETRSRLDPTTVTVPVDARPPLSG